VTSDRQGVPVSVALILLAALGATLLLTTLMRGSSDGPSSSFPAEANGLRVITVADAIEIQAKDDASVIAVAGWYAPPEPVPCIGPAPPIVPLLDGDCSIDFTWLMAAPESVRRMNGNTLVSIGAPAGPAVHPVFDGPDTSWARPDPANGERSRTPVVFIGHFDDARAEGCKPDVRQRCLERLVVTVVAWADGVDFP
jgi:hypothetical protein